MVLFLGLFVAALFLWAAAKLIGIRDASIGKAMVGILGGGLLAFLVLIIVGFILRPLGVIASLITYIWVIKVVFNTDWFRAFMAWLVAGVIEGLVVLITVILGFVTLGSLG
ncbi:hypothetical protein A3L12_06985 [Thermococcus sp. P6]|nr:hypothetical protein A3L12_06985 [Thermococcus sp. P6]